MSMKENKTANNISTLTYNDFSRVHTSSSHQGAKIIFFWPSASINSSHVFTTLIQASLFCFAELNKLCWISSNMPLTCSTNFMTGISTFAELSRRTARTWKLNYNVSKISTESTLAFPPNQTHHNAARSGYPRWHH